MEAQHDMTAIRRLRKRPTESQIQKHGRQTMLQMPFEKI
jgi:hypothetical protein